MILFKTTGVKTSNPTWTVIVCEFATERNRREKEVR
jgi:hypothetical protein